MKQIIIKTKVVQKETVNLSIKVVKNNKIS